MTKENYTLEQTQEYIKIIRCVMQHNPNYYRAEIRRLFPNVYHFIENKNPIIGSYNFQTKLYWILHDMNDFPLCQTCGKPLKKPIEKICKGYPLTCSIECSNANEDKKLKIKNTTVEHWGGIGFASQELNAKERAIFKDKYGSEDPGNLTQFRVKAKQTSIDNWGVDNPMKCDVVKERLRNSMLSIYNVEYYSQSYEYHKNKKHKFHSEKYPGLTFDSTWEVKVYEFCKDNNMLVEYSPKISYPYSYDDKQFTYHPDFLINGKVYEVKGDNFFHIDETTGIEVMVCPYREAKWTDEEYQWHCGKAEAKHQCMIKNKVRLIRRNDLSDMERLFGKQFQQQQNEVLT